MDYYNNNLADALRKSVDVKVFIASNYTEGPDGIKCFDPGSGSKLSKLLGLLTGTLKALNFAKKNQVGYVIIHCFSFELKDLLLVRLVKQFRFKLYSIAHDISGFALNDSQKIRHVILDKLSDKIVVQNLFSLSKIKEFLDPASSAKLALIPHGHFMNLPDRSINYDQARQLLGIEAGQKIVLFFGQIKKVKGLDVLIKALAHCPEDIKLCIAGKPWKDDFKKYQDLITALQLEERIIKKIKYITDEERELLFKAADLIIIPYREIFQSGVLLMAMSYNKLVVASDLPANREIVGNDENGILFKNEDELDLGRKIELIFRAIAQDPGKIESILKSAREKLNTDHSWELIASRYKEIL
jgi:D-inositol-3-phosphate glycosyltransferase